MSNTEQDWKSKLTKEQYQVLRKRGTEPPFSGEYLNNEDPGVYTCAACGSELFRSDSKYESTIPGLIGWPSFGEVAQQGKVDLVEDNSFGMNRIEAVCKTCSSHLGHVFDDHTSPTGKHFCINSIALDFKKGQ